MIYLGNQKIDELHMGGSKISEAYLGSQLVYSAKPNGFTFTPIATTSSYRLNGTNKSLSNLTPNQPNFIQIDVDVTSCRMMFKDTYLKGTLDLSTLNTSKVTDFTYMFYQSSTMASLIATRMDMSKATSFESMFYDCSSLNHIKCKQAFKDWCWANQDTISLPDKMRSGGSGTWGIVG